MTNLSFDHVHYRSSDFDKTRKFYVDIMEAIELSPVELGGKFNLQFELAGVTLLFAPTDEDPSSAQPADKRLGVYHIAFLVDDCKAATEYYRERGAVVDIEPFMAANNIMGAFLDAPDGMWLELKQIIA